jgi:hypothetical protein
MGGFAGFGTFVDGTESFDIRGLETDFVAINAKTPGLVRESKGWPLAFVGIVVGILNEFEQKVG